MAKLSGFALGEANTVRVGTCMFLTLMEVHLRLVKKRFSFANVGYIARMEENLTRRSANSVH